MKNPRSMVGAKRNVGKNSSYDKNSAEYRDKRAKNNNAVKKSRDKSKQKSREASQRVQQLQVENENLKATVDNMQAELRYLKDMLISQAGASDYLSSATEADIEYLLRDDTPTDIEKLTNVLAEMRRIPNMQRAHEANDGISHYSSNYGAGDGSESMYHHHPSTGGY